MEKEREEKQKTVRDFKLTTLALKNRTSIFLLTLFLVVFGIMSYRSMPKELFPDIVMPYVMVQTVYPGNPPVDIENLITRPLEKEIETVSGIKTLKSTSSQDASMVFVEFNSNVEIKDALSDVKDAVDKAMSDLPNDLPSDPMVMDVDFSEFPIININLSGDYSIEELKDYAEVLEEEIEKVTEVSKVNIQGVNEREVKINVDLLKLEAYNLGFRDVENAIAQENVSISGGELKMSNTLRSIRTVGEFTNISEIENIIVKHEKGNIVYLKDLAEVVYGYEDPTSYARLNQQPVVSLQVVKKGGENLLSATAQIEEILDRVQEEHLLPEDLNVTITNDQSDRVKKQLSNLENSMIISIIFVVLVLFFFLGTRNALFVGLAIPLSMFLSFVVLDSFGFQVNMIVLFSLILALGMLVDNAIVVVENIYRFLNNGYTKMQAARRAVGEIAIPIIASTATTLAAFIALAFWDSMMGEFMKYLPITLIIVLTSSLFVALVIIPVFSSVFVKLETKGEGPNKKKAYIIAGSIAVLGALFLVTGVMVLGNLLLFLAILIALNALILDRITKWFQNKFLPWLENFYDRILRFSLRRRNPVYMFIGTVMLLILTLVFLGLRSPKVEFFPGAEPTYINVLAELPIGTDIKETDSLMNVMDQYVTHLLKPNKQIVKSVLTNVGSGAKLERDMSSAGQSSMPNKGLITITFIDYEDRNGVSTSEIMTTLSDSLIGKYPGVVLTIEKNRMGPPTGKPINIEVTGKDFNRLILTADSVMNLVETSNIDGIEGLKMDLKIGNPEMIVTIDREKARRFGMSTIQIAGALRTALYGKEISDYKDGEDEYPIQLRLQDKYRYDVASLMNQKIIFRNNKGQLMKIPISAVADYSYGTSYGSVKRKEMKRVITLYSNVIEGYNANEINDKLKDLLADVDISGYEISFTGEQEDMKDAMAFLEKAMLIAVALIIIILVTQFNSIVKPLIIMSSVVLSTIGVFGGIATFNMNIVIVMTGVGIISLAGVVVNNAIVLIDYIELLKRQKREELGLEPDAYLSVSVATECVVQAGKTRLRPVLLTAITTILGLVPMALGVNIDFGTLFSSYDPNFTVGGDMTVMWGPLSWTVIFGLTFATFLTLIIVPVMYRIVVSIEKRIRNLTSRLKKIGASV
ncbi:MAG: copper transporter [Marinilabiliales bacterium]|nr:MAG: copper transporter [Marinilabiliales bacterium]